MLKMWTCITYTIVQMVKAEMRYECIMRGILIDESRIKKSISINNVKSVHSTSPDMMLIIKELYAVKVWKKAS
ncbi:hypothetical protein TNCV_4926801 [Trichonephila clavipes]|nr:hypothetical protein TNCV_4926801 [Trichonephila clavipes]